MTTNLKAIAVTDLFKKCLSETGTLVEGVVNKAALDTSDHEEEIRAMLDDLPDQFKRTGGGGWSFLNACQDKNDEQWTSEHWVMEQLFMLGMAANLASFMMPREIWDALPGGMPYVVVEV